MVLGKVMYHLYKYGRRNYCMAKIMAYPYIMQATEKEKRDIEKNLDLFVRKEKIIDKKYTKRLKKDIWFSMYYYMCTPDEYFLYDFENKTNKERQEYIGNIEKEAICYRKPGTYKIKMGREANCYIEPCCEVFFDKYKCYEKFKQYYGREMIKIASEEDYEKFDRFILKHKKIVAKPLKSSRGKGVKVYQYKKDVKGLMEEILKQGESVIEELIIPSEKIAVLHPETVNSLRIATYLNDDNTTTIIGAQLRIGVGNNFIDNMSAGGIGAGIDLGSGIIVTDGYDERGNVFERHPDTNIRFRGFQIPMFEECKQLAIELSQVVPERKYVGWDLVFTSSGWIMMEGNCGGQFINFQLPFQRGMRKEIEELFNCRV